jgi:hypothetical protein
MRHRSFAAVAASALAIAAPASATTIVFVDEDGTGVSEFGYHSYFVPKYAGPGVITNVEVKFEGETNQYRDTFGGDDPVVLPAFETSWTMSIEGPVPTFDMLDETTIYATFPEFETPGGQPGEQFTRYTPFIDFVLLANDTRFDLYKGAGLNEFVVYGFGDPVVQARGKLTVTITTNGVVPEPGAWALMLLGFGATGAALRARRRAAAA